MSGVGLFVGGGQLFLLRGRSFVGGDGEDCFHRSGHAVAHGAWCICNCETETPKTVGAILELLNQCDAQFDPALDG